MNERKGILGQILPEIQSIGLFARVALEHQYGPEHRFLAEADQWSAIAPSSPGDILFRYHAKIDWGGQEETVPVALIAVSNQDGASDSLFGNPRVLVTDPNERQVAVCINTDYLPNFHNIDQATSTQFEENNSGHSVTVYISSRRLVDPASFVPS